MEYLTQGWLSSRNFSAQKDSVILICAYEKKNYWVKEVKINLYPKTEWKDNLKNERRRERKGEGSVSVFEVCYFSLLCYHIHDQKHSPEEGLFGLAFQRGSTAAVDTEAGSQTRELGGHISIHTQEAKKTNANWGKKTSCQRLPPVTYFLQQGHIY